MEKFTTLTGVAAPMLMPNINTDLIAPSLMPGRSAGEAAVLPLRTRMFANLRYDREGREKPDFVLNQPRYRSARILLTGPNFGCGSSRETAVWALMEFGIRCVVAPGFGDIFHDNAFQNGLLLIHLDVDRIERIAAALAASNSSDMTVDLQQSLVHVSGLHPCPFALPADRRAALLGGLDQLDLIRASEADILAFERDDALARPWAYPR